MTTANEARLLHHMLDLLVDKQDIGTRNIEKLRAELPEIPKQKTLEELRKEVYAAWLGAGGNTWDYDGHELETWLDELHTQLQGLKDVPANTPALPAGMRIADHEEYGRCVVSPEMDENNEAYRIFYRSEAYITDSFSCYVEGSSLTFIDSEPAAPAHPEFLETEADYTNAPVGTVVDKDSYLLWTKQTDGYWNCTTGISTSYDMSLTECSRVLRWGK